MLDYAVVLFVAAHCLTNARGGGANKGILKKNVLRGRVKEGSPVLRDLACVLP